jgi:hypothetical protein
MTYLEAINSVLRRLREDEVSTALESSYSALIGDFVNDAKRTVENSWNWAALRETTVIPTVSGTAEYSITGSGQEAVIKSVVNDTSNRFMGLQTSSYFNNVYYNQDVISGSPVAYIVSGVDSNDDLKIKVYPQPDGIYSLRFDLAKPQGLITADATKIKVMAQQLQSITITAPGFAGINTQDAPLSQEPTFAAVADNCVIDKEGRIAARKGYSVLNGNDLLGSSDGVESMGEFVAADGNITFFSAGNNKLFSGTATMADETPAGYTITDNNWKMVNFNDHMYFFQRGYEPLVYKDSVGAIEAMSDHHHASGTPPEGHVAIAAFGRMWVADFEDDKSTIYWSDLLDGTAWSGGSTGS